MNIIFDNEINDNEYTNYVFDMFDVKKTTNQKIEIDTNNLMNLNDDWKLMLIVGSSGSGKSSIVNKLYSSAEFSEKTKWDNSKSLIENFYPLSPNDAASFLTRSGLSSVPTWLRKRNMLSTGEGARADIALTMSKQKDITVIDEFTSTINREVAMSLSTTISKMMKSSSKKLICVGCHFDVIDWLDPDIIYNTDTKKLIDRRSLRHEHRKRPNVNLSIYEAKYDSWKLFSQHHYLNASCSRSAKNFIIYFNDTNPVAFVSIATNVHNKLINCNRISRIVVLPDFQGMGIASSLINYFGELFLYNGRNLSITTAHPALHHYFDASKSWVFTSSSNNHGNNPSSKIHNDKCYVSGRPIKSYSYENEMNLKYDFFDVSYTKQPHVLTLNENEIEINENEMFIKNERYVKRGTCITVNDETYLIVKKLKNNKYKIMNTKRKIHGNYDLSRLFNTP